MASSRPTTAAFWEAYFKDSSNDTRCRSGINNNVFVAVLIATVTFSAPFTIEDTSHGYSAFCIFLYFDAAAFAASMLAVLYAITCSPYSTAVADKQMLMLTRIIYIAIYSCVGAFCAAIVLIFEKARLNGEKASLDAPASSVTSDRSTPDMVHAKIIATVIGALFLLSLIPAFLWFFCKHQYMDFQPFPKQERTLGQCPGLPGMVCKPFLKVFCIELKTINEADEPPEEGYLKQYLSKEEVNAAQAGRENVECP